MKRMIPALTISQPFASMIASGEKWVENRHWATSYRGRILIHAGKGTQYLTRAELANYPTGCIVAVGELSFCINLKALRFWEASTPEHQIGGRRVTDVLAHEHTEGPVCWILRSVRPIDPPIPYRGDRGLWQCIVDDDLIPGFNRLEDLPEFGGG